MMALPKIDGLTEAEQKIVDLAAINVPPELVHELCQAVMQLIKERIPHGRPKRPEGFTCP
jgi:hypothetical protein